MDDIFNYHPDGEEDFYQILGCDERSSVNSLVLLNLKSIELLIFYFHFKFNLRIKICTILELFTKRFLFYLNPEFETSD